MSKIISSATMLKSSPSTAGPGFWNYEMYSYNAIPELVDKLCEYKYLIGVTEYKKDEYGIFWLLNGHWYKQAQIERILQLKSFV